MSNSQDAARRQALPEVVLSIEVRRDLAALEIESVELLARGQLQSPNDITQRLRWKMRSPLLPDELLIIFGKPLEWAGASTRALEDIPHVEDVFPTPVALGPQKLEVLSEAARVDFPDAAEIVAWPFGIVLLRGHDIPLTADSHLRIRRIG